MAAVRLSGYYAQRQTNKTLEQLESEIASTYKDAWEDVSKKAKDYFDTFKKRDAEYLAGLKAGEIQPPAGKTIEQHYAEWRQAQLGRGERWNTLKDELASRMVDADKITAAMINDTTPSVYSLAHNRTCYEIYKATGGNPKVSFTLINEQTVKNLMLGANQSEFKVTIGPKLYEFRRNLIHNNVDYKWNTRQIENALKQGILAGDSITHMTDRFFSVMESNHKAAVRNARTSVTSAYNAGNLASMHEAEEMGIKMKKEWMATLDDRTRDSHQWLDGTRVDIDEDFPNGLRYPGDPNGEPAEVYNCRCTMVEIIEGVNEEHGDRIAREGGNGSWADVSDMTYKGNDGTQSYDDWLEAQAWTSN